MQDKTPPHPSAAREASLDMERLATTIAGRDHGTDPFVAAVRATRMPMIITDPRTPDNPVVFVNDAFCRLTGYARTEIVGRNCRFLQGPDTDPDSLQRIRDAVRARRSIEIDIRNYRKNGEPFWNRLLLAPVNDAEGTLSFFFASQVDVTLERERLAGLEHHNAALSAELAGRLREQEDRENELRFALEAGRFGAWTLDTGAGEMTTSSACRANFGRDPDQPFTFDDFQAAIHPEDRQGVQDAIARSVATGEDYAAEYRAMTPAGETRWIELRARPLRGTSGAMMRLSGVSHDITERKRQDRFRQALVDLGGLFRDILDTAAVAVAAGRILGQTLGISRAGYGTVDPVAETITIEGDWNAPDTVSLSGTYNFRDYGSYIDNLKRGETVVVADADEDRRTASTVDALRSINAQAFINCPVIEAGGMVALLYITNKSARAWQQDELTFVWEVAHRTRGAMERRRAEQKLALLAASLEQQVADRTRELMQAEEALRQSQKMEAIGQLTGGVAHDFNNLLTVIRSSVDLMRRPNLPEERRKRYIDAISDTVARASRLTGQLLAFARRQALKPEVFDVGERLRGVADMLDSIMGARIEVVTKTPDDPCAVRADVSQFETALVNMAVNARDAMEGEGTLTVTLLTADAIPPMRGHAGAMGRFVAVSMTDTGRGIPTDQIGHIFEPFYTTKEVGKGTGLGLSQVFGFAKQSGGDVSVDSALDSGATFTLYLPEVETPIRRATGPSDAPAGVALGGGGRRVLVVEDNLDVGRFSTQVLQDLGYETQWVTSADEAILTLAAAVPPPFDVVFSDVVMPGRSGVELAKQIRTLYPHLPVVLTSGYSHVLAEEGPHGFELLHKPYSAEQVSRVLRQATRRGGTERRIT